METKKAFISWYNFLMPRLKRNLVFPLARGLKVFLRLDMGVGRRVPEIPEEQIQRVQQHLHRRYKEQIQRIRQRSQKQLHRLPEPNESISNFQIFHSLVSSFKPGKMLDLGTGAGTFSLIAARLGWEVTAVDARTVRTPDPEAEKDPNGAELLRSVRWVEADVRELEIPKGDYDLICIFGLLHHLELDAQIKLLKRCSHTLTFLAVRVEDHVVSKEGLYEGNNYREPGATRKERDQVPWASWGNEASFKHTEESLLRLFQESGYTHVMAMRPPFEHNYTFYLCLPAPLTPLNLEDLPVDVQEVRYHNRNTPPAGEAQARDRSGPAGVQPTPPDPNLPHLGAARDPELMREVFQGHLRSLGGRAYWIRECRISGIRYRKGMSCSLQYTLRLEEPATGRERDQWVTGTMYSGGKTRRKWEKLRRTEPAREILEAEFAEIPGAASPAFAPPFSYPPDPEMLVQVFPYDHRLEALHLLMAGPTPELEPLLLAEFREGKWRTEAWNTELVRYQPESKATVRLTVRAQDATSGRAQERSFYAQVYGNEVSGERTHQVHKALWAKAGMGDTGFTVARPIAYLSGLRTFLQEEVPGTPLLDLLLHREEEAIPAVLRAARALASLHLSHVDTPRRHSLRDEVAVLEGRREDLKWACPHLGPDIENIFDAVVAGLEEAPPAPTHRDFAFDHIMVEGDDLALIDLDQFAEADPVLDVAIVLAHLTTESLISALPRNRARKAARVFAEEYFAYVPEAWRARLPFLYAGAVLKTAAGIFWSQQTDWPDKVEVLIEEAEGSLAGRVW